MTATKTFFLTRDKKLNECEVVKTGPHRRDVRMLEGEQVGKTISVHPEGVAWGQMYPRLFHGSQAPKSVFVHQGRALAQLEGTEDHPAVPSVNPHYRFQPFLTHLIDSIHAEENVILTGGTGVGKTTHVTQLAARVGQPLLRINFNGETRMSDLVGKIQVIDGETRWVDGVLPMAMRKGYWLLLDELDFADPSVLSLLHPVLEEEPMLVLKENSGEIIKPHPDFRLFATANSIGAMQDRASAYAGTTQMNEAFLDRWQVLFVDNLPAVEEIKVLRAQVPGLKSVWAKQIVDFANRARRKEATGGYEFSGDNFSTRKTLAWARKAALHRSPLVGAKLSWMDKLAESEQEAVGRALKVHFGTGKKGLGKVR
jgi:cobaltochelatase CobS